MAWQTVEKRRAWQKRYCPEYYAKNREKIAGYNLNWRLKNPEKVLFMSARRRAREKNLSFTIELSDVVIPERCPILGIPIFPYGKLSGNSEKRNQPNSPSLDRIRPELGYIKGNIQIISWRANDLKKNATLAELLAIVRHLMGS